MAPKSIFRQPGAKHFQLVHRSQRDPLIHDPDASQRVLKEIKKGKSRAQLESSLEPSDIDARVGEAAIYGVYYDDSEYDYMQHLRPIGVQEDGVDSVLIEAPSSSKPPAPKSKHAGITLKDLPQGVLPSTVELPKTYESQQGIPDSISGFRPDMDPHLRQVLEALEDDAFVEDELEDDFFGELVKEGERGSDEDVEFEFHEDGLAEGEERDEDKNSWEYQFAQFKKHQKNDAQSDDEDTEAGDTVPGLPSISVAGCRRKRRKGSSLASGLSMSSSSIYRNEALQTLDERFDQVMLKEYNSDEEDEDEDEDHDISDDEAPQLITSREDFTSMMDEFLNDFEILGRKLKPKLSGDTGAEKLKTLRRAMGQDERVKVNDSDSDEENDDFLLETEDDKKDRWDCETILTTYTNLENHPRLIRARDPRPVPTIRLDPKTGLPSVMDPGVKAHKKKQAVYNSDSTDNSDEDEDFESIQTITRPRNESPEAKKARKAAVKAERAARRVEKKSTKETFGSEFKTQTKMRLGRDKERGMRKL